MTFSFLKQISSGERTSRLLNQPAITTVSKIDDRIAEAGGQRFDFFLRAVALGAQGLFASVENKLPMATQQFSVKR